MKVVFGLGNPEQKYDGTRHNIGFFIVNTLASDWGAELKLNKKFKAKVGEVTIDNQKILLVKPDTYYNLVGESARAIADFYKLEPSDFLIIHDDLDLPLGTIRTRLGGSSGGNNGLKSLEYHLGSNTSRLRIGTNIDNENQKNGADFVLSKFKLSEQQIINQQLNTVQSVISSFIQNNLPITTLK